MKTYFVAAVAALAVAAPASATEFAGPYIGAGVNLDNIQGSGSAEGIGFNGVGGTVFAGYDLPVSPIAFVGVEANADLYSADIGNSLEADWGWGISGRLGAKINDATALYARVGYAQARLEALGDGEWFEGVRYGAGIETAVSAQLSLRAELTQINYEADLINNQAGVAVSYRF